MEKNTALGSHAAAIEPAVSIDGPQLETEKGGVATCEVFQETSEGVNFRTVSWQRATVLFLKIQFAMSILAVPGALGTLGAVGGALSIVGWQTLNTCTIPLGHSFFYFLVFDTRLLCITDQLISDRHGNYPW